jgi:hypothetical protein
MGCEIEGNGSGLWPMVGFLVTGVETSDSNGKFG